LGRKGRFELAIRFETAR